MDHILHGITYTRKSIPVRKMAVADRVQYQQVALEKYARANQIEIIKQFSDAGYTGSNANRPELQEMLSFLQNPMWHVNVLLIYSIDRLCRDIKDNINLFNEIASHVDRVVFVREGLSCEKEGFKILLLILAAQAEDSRLAFLRRLSDGRNSRVFYSKNIIRANIPLGDTRQGKKLVSASEKTTKNIAEVQGGLIVRQIFDRCLMGDSLDEIAKCLNETYGSTR